jgi:hypothetical protein
MAFSLGQDSTAAELSLETFDAIHDALLACATLPIGGPKGTTQEIRDRALELLLGVAVTRGSLSYFLSVVNLLLHAARKSLRSSFLFYALLSCASSIGISSSMYAIEDGKKSVAMRGLLRKLRAVQRESVLDLPSPKKLDGFVAVPDLSTGWGPGSFGSMATDGTYLYLHNHGGLFKIGTGFNGTTPGTIYGQIKGFRGTEQSAMVCIGDRLYYRSANLYPILFSVISTQHLTEIGSIRRDGAGSVATPDLSWYFPVEEDDKKNDGDVKEGKMERDGKSSDRPSATPLIARPVAAAPSPYTVSLTASSSTGTSSSSTSTSTAAMLAAMQATRLKQMRGQIFGDGTFLYALQPRPIGEKPAAAGVPHPTPTTGTSASATPATTHSTGTTAAFVPPVATPGVPYVLPVGPTFNFGQAQPQQPQVSSGFSFSSGSATGWGSNINAPASYSPFSQPSTGGWGTTAPTTSLFATPAPLLPTAAGLPPLPITDPKLQRGEYAIQVFEPSRGFDHCHSTVLYRPTAEGRNNTVLSFKSNQIADPLTGRRPAYAMMTLGNPEHLNFAGTITLECWIKVPRDIWAQRGTIGLFYHGDGRSNLYMYISSHQLYMGYQGTTGNQAVAVSITATDTAEWFHVAGIYDQATQQFRLHLNGSMLRNQVDTFLS